MPEEIVTQPNETTDAARRRAYVNGLRQLAAFLEEHPDLPCPWAANHLVGAKDKATLIAIARTPGIRWHKDWTGTDYFSLCVKFDGGHVYDVYVPRQEVCEKVVTGTVVVPAQPERVEETFTWECRDALLAGGEA